MSWSYSGSPSTSDKDAVRFAIGDTSADDPLLQDGEIAYLLQEHGSVARAAVAACEAVIAKLSRDADMSSGATSISSSQRREHYAKLLQQLRRKATSRPAIRMSQTEPPRFSRGDDKNRRP